MPPPVYLAADFLAALQALMPRGRVWPREPDAKQTSVLSGLTPTYERSNARADYLLVDAFPATTSELLPEWEASLGLPDPCLGGSPSVAQRVAQVVARFTSSGGQSVPYFIAFAATLGYPITIQEFTTARIGVATIGQPINNDAWAYAWAVHAPALGSTPSRIGASVIGDPLVAYGNQQLTCELNRIAPAHTAAIYDFGS